MCHIPKIFNYLRSMGEACNYFEQQNEEIEALKAIFDEEFTDISSNPVCFMIKLNGAETKNVGSLNLKVTLPQSYPACPPVLDIPNRSGILSQQQHETLLRHLRSVAEDNIGEVMVYTLVEAARAWLADQPCQPPDSLLPLPPAADQQEGAGLNLTDVHITEAKVIGGRWDYIIGLVGKPSAGKSTFFNAATVHGSAKVGAHPFTTIDPNIGKAYYAIPCPCAKLDTQCNAAYGHNFRGERHVAVLLKDVAGLVPGACEGKGRGNRFLNDLLDADVLIHIVDVSGTTNEHGEQTTGYDPAADIVWLRQELHRWIYDNVMEKWDNIKRKPLKLIDMFTGYHANKATIHLALQKAGVEKSLSSIADWKEDVLHRIVSCFLDIRFPVLHVLNKADMPGANEIINRVLCSHPGLVSVPVSAKSECLLQEWAEKGLVAYSPGQGQVKVTEQLSSQQQQSLGDIQQGVLDVYGSTNVHAALSQAVQLRSPTYAFPVHDLDLLTSIDKYKGEPAGTLRDCISLKPGTTVEELYQVMLHHPTSLAAGDFIRAEACDPVNHRKWIVKKEDIIFPENAIIKIMTNRKVSPVKSRDSLAS